MNNLEHTIWDKVKGIHLNVNTLTSINTKNNDRIMIIVRDDIRNNINTNVWNIIYDLCEHHTIINIKQYYE